nr:HEPN domain-containing protein [Thermoplasma sp. Kam2015]
MVKNAKYTPKSAHADMSTGFYSLACFKAKQTAEFAAKAYLRGIGEDSFGYSVSVLLGKAKFGEDLINLAKKLTGTISRQDIQMPGLTIPMKITILWTMLKRPLPVLKPSFPR